MVSWNPAVCSLARAMALYAMTWRPAFGYYKKGLSHPTQCSFFRTPHASPLDCFSSRLFNPLRNRHVPLPLKAMNFNFIDNLHQGTGHTTGHDCISYASFHPVSAIPNRNGTQQPARSLLNFSSVPDSASNLPSLSSVYFPFRHHQLQPSTAPSFNPSSQPISTSSYNPLQLNTTPSYNPLQSSSAISYNPLQPSAAPLPHSLQQSATVQLTNTPSTLVVGGPSHGAGLDSAPILLDISNILVQSSAAVPNQGQSEIQAEHQLIPKNALAFGRPVQGTSPIFDPFSPSMLSSSHFPSQTDTAPHHYVIADQVDHQLISTRAVTVISPTPGASFDSAGPFTQLYPPPNTADQDHYGSSRQAAPLLSTSIPSTILNPNSGTGPAASVEKLTHHVSTQYPCISTDPPLARSYPKAATGNRDIADCPGRSDQNIGIKLTLCPADKPCVYGSPLCGSCYAMLSIISEEPSQARQFTRSSVEARELLTAAPDRHTPPGYGVNVHGGPNYPDPTLAHINPHPYPLQHQPSPEQSRTKLSYQPPLLAPENAQSERQCACQQQVQQLKAQVLSLEQKFQQLQSCLMYWEQPPSIHKQKRSLPKTRPSSQWLKSPGYVSPKNHDDTSRELPCCVEEVFQ